MSFPFTNSQEIQGKKQQKKHNIIFHSHPTSTHPPIHPGLAPKVPYLGGFVVSLVDFFWGCCTLED